MREVVERLKEAFSTTYKKILIEQQGDYHALFLLKDGREGLIVCLRRSDRAYYAKIYDLAKAVLWNCIHIIEDPRGLYAFAREVDELIGKIIDKAKKLG